MGFSHILNGTVNMMNCIWLKLIDTYVVCFRQTAINYLGVMNAFNKRILRIRLCEKDKED